MRNTFKFYNFNINVSVLVFLRGNLYGDCRDPCHDDHRVRVHGRGCELLDNLLLIRAHVHGDDPRITLLNKINFYPLNSMHPSHYSFPEFIFLNLKRLLNYIDVKID